MRPALRLVPTLALLAACESAPLQWEEAVARPGTPATTESTLPLATYPADPDGRRCDASLRAVRLVPPAPTDRTAPMDHAAMGHAMPDSVAAPAAVAAPGDTVGPDHWVAVWWAVRPDSSVRLRSARTTDGGRTWAPAIPVDTFDRGARGCARPAPGLAWEPASRYVHVAYFLEAPEGAGLFYAHSMDAGLLYDPEPEPIVYGPRPSRAAVAARRDTVVVAYEDPNGPAPTVALAFSATGGHIFPEKAIPVSTRSAAAGDPAVQVDSLGVTVRWVERRQGQAVPMERRGRWR